MDQQKPDKEKVREYMARRQSERRKPPHDQEQIRTEVGWLVADRRVRDRRGEK